MFYFGMREYGPVHQVPGVFHVATRFFHIYFIPVVPMGTVLVVHPKMYSREPAVIPIAWNVKSILFAWLRAGLLLGGIAAGIAALEMRPLAKGAVIDWPSFWGKIATAVALHFVWWQSYRWTHASKETAIKLCDQNGIGYPIRGRVELFFGEEDDEESADRMETTVESPQFRLEDIRPTSDAR